MSIKGVDVSSHQGKIDWHKVKNDGIKFAIIRGGYGTSKVDDYFKYNIEQCIKYGIEVGIYWFSYATNTNKAKEEAKLCIKTINPYKKHIRYPVFYDLEYDTIRYAKTRGVIINKTKATAFSNAFIAEIKKNGYKVGLYTNLDYAKNYFQQSLLDSVDVWVANYSSKCYYKGKYTIWQYSEKGRVNGMNTHSVDMNLCYKDYIGSEKVSNSDNKVINQENKETVLRANMYVKSLQIAMNKSYGCKLDTDGLFGNKTKAQVEKHYLDKGKKNEHVKWLQMMLNKKNKAQLVVDGSYGDKTEKAVKDFQKVKGLSIDGIAGLKTHMKLI